MRGGREQVEAVCLKNKSFELREDVVDGMSAEEQYKLVREALRVFLKSGKAEFPLLLKHFGVDLKNGQKLMDFFERRGFVGTELPDRSRKVKITMAQFEELFGESVSLYMQLDEQPFEAIASGKKSVELRLNDGCGSLKVGDRVVFLCRDRSIKVEVVRLTCADRFSDLSIAILYDAGLKDLKAKDVDNFMRFSYSKKEVAKNGVIAISFKVLEVN